MTVGLDVMEPALGTISLIIAIYGAIVATIVAAWNIYREATNRGRLRVQAVEADMIAPGVGAIANGKLWIKVTNVGRQSIFLTKIGGRNKRGSTRSHFVLITAKQLPVKLEPGEEWDDTSADVSSLDPQKVRYLAAWDSMGKVHKVPRRQLKELFKR